jgi:hypothetical protein
MRDERRPPVPLSGRESPVPIAGAGCHGHILIPVLWSAASPRPRGLREAALHTPRVRVLIHATRNATGKPQTAFVTRLAILAGVVSLSLPPARAAAQNLLGNGGFEAGVGTYPGVGKYWETNDGNPHPDIDVLDPIIRHSGLLSQHLKASSVWDLGMVRQVSDYDSVQPGRTYHVEAWIRTANVFNPAGWYVFGIWWLDAADQVVGEVKMPRQETNNYDWRLIWFRAEAPPAANRVAALLTRHTDGDAWYDDVSITMLPTTPMIERDPLSFVRTVTRDGKLADDTFTVWNGGSGTLDYTLTEAADWLSISPAAGTSAGETNTITIRYNTSGLAPGPYSAAITIADPAAGNNPQVVSVNITVRPVYVAADFDQDSDVDLADFAMFQLCFAGPNRPPGINCSAGADFDNDGDVDLADFAAFQACFNGPNRPPACD